MDFDDDLMACIVAVKIRLVVVLAREELEEYYL